MKNYSAFLLTLRLFLFVFSPGLFRGEHRLVDCTERVVVDVARHWDGFGTLQTVLFLNLFRQLSEVHLRDSRTAAQHNAVGSVTPHRDVFVLQKRGLKK